MSSDICPFLNKLEILSIYHINRFYLFQGFISNQQFRPIMSSIAYYAYYVYDTYYAYYANY